MSHPRVRLAQRIDWGFLEQKFGAVYSDGPGSPPLPTRLMAGLHILKYSENLSDERLCELLAREPLFSVFLRRGVLPAQARLRPLVADALAAAHGRGAAQRADPGEPCGCGEDRGAEAVRAYRRWSWTRPCSRRTWPIPTDAKLLNRARERLVRLAKKHGVVLRQSYARVGKFALIKQQRYAHAKQFKRANKRLKNAQDLSWPRDPRHPAQDRRRRGFEGRLRPTLYPWAIRC